MTFTFVPAVSETIFTQLFDGASWANFEAPFVVIDGQSITVSRIGGITLGKTQIRLFGLMSSTVVDGPGIVYTILHLKRRLKGISLLFH